jgi:mannosyltransferase OCH1-like enzyme
MSTIPKIIHQTWKDENVPECFHHWQCAVLAHHPSWEYRLWTDADARAFIASCYPQDLPLYDALPRNIMRADVLRYFLMDHFGGFYLDLDYEVLKPFDELCDRHALVLPCNRDSGDEGIESRWEVGNAIFGSVPGHPFWKQVLDAFRKASPSADRVGLTPDVEKITGPQFLTDLIHLRSPLPEERVWLAPRRLFHPPLDNGQAPLPDALSETTYGIHHCQGTWRLPHPKVPLLLRIVRRLNRFFGRSS